MQTAWVEKYLVRRLEDHAPNVVDMKIGRVEYTNWTQAEDNENEAVDRVECFAVTTRLQRRRELKAAQPVSAEIITPLVSVGDLKVKPLKVEAPVFCLNSVNEELDVVDHSSIFPLRIDALVFQPVIQFVKLEILSRQ